MFTNRYIFIYSTVMVIIVATILSAAAMFLKPYQDRNIAIAKIQGILASADIEASTEDAETLFQQYIQEELILDNEGNTLSLYKDGNFEKGDERAFELNLKTELYNKSQGKDFKIPLYIADVEGQKVFIVPLLGKGLWGPIWGNIAFKQDFNEVLNASFVHSKETPGLGAEIDTRNFSDQFIGKTIFDGQGEFTSITVVKGGVGMLPEDMQIHGVDAISGGTITCNGLTDMLDDCLENYVSYIKKIDE
jgi:Na+-transporting NADH:ubiquinone oxidoreductase subunit C